MSIVYLCNAYECFASFIKKIDWSSHTQISFSRMKRELDFFGDRSVYFQGSSKYIYTPLKIAHIDYTKSLGFEANLVIPVSPETGLLCKDIINQPPEILDASNELSIVPYCSTHEFYELVKYWNCVYKLNFSLPESPRSSLSKFREEIDKKSVFSMLAKNWLNSTQCLVSERVVCETLDQASAAVSSFLEQGKDCVVKPDTGYLGLGLIRFTVNQDRAVKHLKDFLKKNPYLVDEKILVEAWIPSGTECQSPSVEVFVPQAGEPFVTYICDQVFSDAKLFAGIALRPEFYETAWAQTLSKGALAVARRLQSLGYCGYFDLDAVVDPDGQVYVVEMNPRRTGGTHVHEMAEFLVGQDYRQKVALLSGSLTLKQACTWPELEVALRDAGLLYPHGTVIPVQTSSLPWGVFGYVVMAADWDAVQFWHGHLLELLT